MYIGDEKVRLHNGSIVNLVGKVKCLDRTEAYYTDQNFIVTLDMIKEIIK